MKHRVFIFTLTLVLMASGLHAQTLWPETSDSLWPETLGADSLGIHLFGAVEGYFFEEAGLDIDRHLSRNPTLNIIVAGTNAVGFSYRLSNMLTRVPPKTEAPVSSLPASFAGNPVDIDNKTLYEGYVSYDSGGFGVLFGRDVPVFGPIPGGLYPGANLPYLDHLKVDVPFSFGALEWMVATLENRKGPGDVTPETPEYDFGTTIIAYSAHRLEFGTGSVRFGIGEQAVHIREQNAFQLADFFPLSSIHQTDIVPNNMALIFDLAYDLDTAGDATVQIGFDEINANIFGIGDVGNPTIYAMVTDYRTSLRLAGLPVDLGANAGVTHYLWGNFDLALGRAVFRYHSDAGNIPMPLWAPRQPGTTWVEVEGKTMFERLGLSAGAALDAAWYIPGLSITQTAYESNATYESGQRAFRGEVRLSLSWEPLSGLAIYADTILGTNVDSAVTFDVDATAGISYRTSFEF